MTNSVDHGPKNLKPSESGNTQGAHKEKKSNFLSGFDWAHIEDRISEYLPVIGIFAVLLVVGVTGYFGYDTYQKSKNLKTQNALFSFRTETFNPFVKEKKLSGDQVFENWNQLSEKFSGQEALFPMGIEVAQKFIELKDLPKAQKILSSLYESHQKNPTLGVIVGNLLVSVEDDLGEFQKAISILEKLTSLVGKDSATLSAKIYFDLGRMYLKEKNQEKAELNFRYIIENFPDDRYAHLAKIYLKHRRVS
jgi:predicted negative regulator of RcsB-dependent stress response